MTDSLPPQSDPPAETAPTTKTDAVTDAAEGAANPTASWTMTPPPGPWTMAGSPEGAAPAAPAPKSSGGVKSWLIAGGAAAVAAIVAVAIMSFTGHGSTSNAAGNRAQDARFNAGGYGGNFGRGQGNGMARNGVAGKVTAMHDGTLTVTETFGGARRFGTNGSGSNSKSTKTTYKVKTTSKTKVTEAVAGKIADLATGDTVTVVGKRSGTTIAATRISQTPKILGQRRSQFGNNQGSGQANGQGPAMGYGGPPAGGPGGNQPGFGQGSNSNGNAGNRSTGTAAGALTFGTIQSISGSKVTIKNAQGTTETVTTTTSTKVRVTKTINVADIKVGDTIRATGKVSSSTVTATAIVVGADDFGGGEFGGGFGGGFGPGGNAGGNGGGSGMPPGAPGSDDDSTSSTTLDS